MTLKITTTCNWLICRTPLQDLSRKTIGTYILTAKKYSVNAIHNWPRLLKLSYLEWPRLILIYNCICHRCCNFYGLLIDYIPVANIILAGFSDWKSAPKLKTTKRYSGIPFHVHWFNKNYQKNFFHLISGSNFCVMLLIVISLPLTGEWATVLFCACVFRDCLDRVIELKL